MFRNPLGVLTHFSTVFKIFISALITAYLFVQITNFRSQKSECFKKSTRLTTQTNLLQTYQIYARSVNEEHQLARNPLRYIDLKYKRPINGLMACQVEYAGRTPSIIVIVHSRLENYNKRARLRREFCSSISRSNSFFRPIFIVSTDNTKNTQEIGREHVEHGDILEIVNVAEHYHNISYKARAWIDYLAREYEARGSRLLNFVLKLDDDVYVDTLQLSELLTRFHTHRRVILCRVFANGQITRNSASKWYLSPTDYKAHSFGLFCQGMAYVLTADLLPKMRTNIERVQYLWMDDWYVTHALMNETQATFFDIRSHVISTNSASETRALAQKSNIIKSPPIFAHFRPAFAEEEETKLWEEIREKYRNCAKADVD